MDSILTLGTIRDYILFYFPHLLWWDGFNKHEEWKNNKNYKHRQGMPNEIRIEFDSENKENNWRAINETAINLFKEGYSFAIFYVEGGRSPHIHIYDLDELEQLNFEQRKIYRQKFLKKICPKEYIPDFALCDEKHLCALEFVNHFKYNCPKELLFYFGKGGGYQKGIDSSIKTEILNKKEEPKKYQKKQIKLSNIIQNKTDSVILGNLTFEQVFDKYEIPYRGKMALCPFHSDGDNSLSFSNEKGLWKCWGDGCGAKGDIITLIKKLKELNQNGNKE